MLKDYYVMKERFYLFEKTDDLYAAKWGNVMERIDLNDEQLEPFQGLNFAIIGFKCDKGVYINHGRPGSIEGPMAIRQQLAKMPWHLGREVHVFDAGDIEGVNSSLSDLQVSLAHAIERMRELNLYPIVLGGGHETAFGHYSGLRASKPIEQKLAVINFDAHFDLRPYDQTGPNSGTGFRQMYDLNKASQENFKYLALGIQEHSNNLFLFDFVAKSQGIEFMTGLDMYTTPLKSIYQEVDSFMDNSDQIYLTIDMDCFYSAASPGVSAIQSVGLDPRMVILIAQHIAASGKLCSFDIVETSPAYDIDNHSANLAATLVFYLTQTLANSVQRD
ncbi:formimidoylglutamase [Vaginisenegalia massiliensis]|uniref:formimidoylglutamase n=1 Tax=Vaginisenegalia massiliensis TaxID=2058294 RepID=UPI000F54122C|nr:formimidoylglutamase [Vaginisenegalia massiliensis]